MEPIYMTALDGSRRYRIARSTMYEIMNMPESPRTLKVGRTRLLPIAEYDKFMRQRFFNNEERKIGG